MPTDAAIEKLASAVSSLTAGVGVCELPSLTVGAAAYALGFVAVVGPGITVWGGVVISRAIRSIR